MIDTLGVDLAQVSCKSGVHTESEVKLRQSAPELRAEQT